MEDKIAINVRLGEIQPQIGIDVVLTIVGMFSFLINGIIIYIIIFKRKKDMAIDQILILMIAILDTVASLYTIINQIIKWIIGYNNLDIKLFCSFSMLVFCSATFISIVITGLLSIVRYVIIVKNYKIDNKYFIVLFAFLMLFLYIMMNLSTFTLEPRVMPSAIYCLPSISRSIFSKLFLFVITIFVIPCIFIIPIFYLLVLNHYRKLVNSINNLNEIYPYKTPFKRRLFDSTVIRFLLIIMAYLICLCPEFLLAVYTITARKARTALADGIVILLLFSVTLVNGTFVLTLHEESKDSFKRLLGWTSRLPPSSSTHSRNHSDYSTERTY